MLLSAVMLIAAFGPATVFAGDKVFARLTDPVSKWNYTYYYNGRITLMVYTGNSENVVVPDKIGGLSVDGFEPGYKYMAENHTVKHVKRDGADPQKFFSELLIAGNGRYPGRRPLY